MATAALRVRTDQGVAAAKNGAASPTTDAAAANDDAHALPTQRSTARVAAVSALAAAIIAAVIPSIWTPQVTHANAGGVKRGYEDPQTARFTYREIMTNRAIRLNPVCKELYLDDKEFHTVFGMDKDAFWKQPAWKQRDAKKKKGLF
mgnify:CR=1 FL=1